MKMKNKNKNIYLQATEAFISISPLIFSTPLIIPSNNVDFPFLKNFF